MTTHTRSTTATKKLAKGVAGIELSRRSLFQGAAALSVPALLTQYHPTTIPRLRATLDLVQPLAAKDVADGYGVCAHPAFQRSVYADVDAWMGRLAAMGVKYFRGTYNPSNAGCRAAVVAARKHSVKWLMIVVEESQSGPTDQSVAQTVARVRDIAINAADVCYGIEGVNEPNQNRSSTVPVPLNWAVTATKHQKAIWATAKADPRLARLPIVGPSLHNTAAMQSYTQSAPSGGKYHYLQLKNAGIAGYQTWQGLHAYSNGESPCHRLDDRLDHIYAAFGRGCKVWVTETGFTTATSMGVGQKPASEAAAATYGAQSVLEFAKRGIRVTRYEMLDDVDAGAKDVQESNFGLFRVGTNDAGTWTAKPEVAKLTTLLKGLRDAGPAYVPAKVQLTTHSAASDVQVTVVGRRDGTTKVYLYRGASVWNAATRTAVSVPTTTVTVTDRIGARTITVGTGVVAVSLR